LCLLRLRSEKALDGGEDAGGGVVLAVGVGCGGEALRRSAMIKLRDSTRSGLVSKTRFIAAWPISSTSVLLERETLAVRAPCKQRHLAEEVAFVEVATVRGRPFSLTWTRTFPL
jgi:hypothetical protein